MINRRTALWSGGMGLMLSCIFVGCVRREVNFDQENLVLSAQAVTVTQGYDATPIGFVRGEKIGLDKIEGEQDGVTARFAPPGFITVSAAKDAKVGQVDLTIKNKAGKTASLKVTVVEPIPPTGVARITMTTDVDVEQGKEVTPAINISKDVDKLGGVTISEGKDGLSSKLNHGEFITITLSATKEAKLGVQEISVKNGTTPIHVLKVTVKAAAAK